MQPLLRALIEANREIVSRLKGDFDLSLLREGSVGAGGDISKEADLLAERIFYSHLESFGTIESEESGIMGDGIPSIILDPLDGSANFASGIPYYGSSVAKLDARGELEAAAVCNFVSGELFVKFSAETVQCWDIHSGRTKEPLLIPDGEVGIFEKAYAHPEVAAALLEAGLKFRSPGATALSLAYARNAAFFLFVGRSRLYDIAAGLALCEGMAVIVEEDYVIVSQSKVIAEHLESIIRRSII